MIFPWCALGLRQCIGAQHRAGIVMLLCALAVAACHAPSAPQPSVEQDAMPLPSSSVPATPPTSSAHLGSPFAVASYDSAAALADVNDFNALIAPLPDVRRAEVTAWYKQYAADSMAFSSAAQWQWMRKLDYPAPDDVLRAASLSEARLRELALHGDIKANFFYLARLESEIARAGGLAALPIAEQTRLQGELTGSMDRALASGSPFAGYLFGGYYATLHGAEGAAVGSAAGLVWAAANGDTNAHLRNQRASMGFPGVSGVRTAEVYFDMVAAAARINPNFQFAMRRRDELLIP